MRPAMATWTSVNQSSDANSWLQARLTRIYPKLSPVYNGTDSSPEWVTTVSIMISVISVWLNVWVILYVLLYRRLHHGFYCVIVMICAVHIIHTLMEFYTTAGYNYFTMDVNSWCEVQSTLSSVLTASLGVLMCMACYMCHMMLLLPLEYKKLFKQGMNNFALLIAVCVTSCLLAVPSIVTWNLNVRDHVIAMQENITEPYTNCMMVHNVHVYTQTVPCYWLGMGCFVIILTSFLVQLSNRIKVAQAIIQQEISVLDSYFSSGNNKESELDDKLSVISKSPLPYEFKDSWTATKTTTDNVRNKTSLFNEIDSDEDSLDSTVHFYVGGKAIEIEISFNKSKNKNNGAISLVTTCLDQTGMTNNGLKVDTEHNDNESIKNDDKISIENVKLDNNETDRVVEEKLATVTEDSINIEPVESRIKPKRTSILKRTVSNKSTTKPKEMGSKNVSFANEVQLRNILTRDSVFQPAAVQCPVSGYMCQGQRILNRLKFHKLTVVMLICMFLSYIACSLPFHVYIMVVAVSDGGHYELYNDKLLILHWMRCIVVLVHPILCLTVSPELNNLHKNTCLQCYKRD